MEAENAQEAAGVVCEELQAMSVMAQKQANSQDE